MGLFAIIYVAIVGKSSSVHLGRIAVMTMANYILELTQEEFDELEQIVKMEEKCGAINLITNGKSPEKAKLRERNRVQNLIIGKMMDARREAKYGKAKPLSR